jgi:hypothetical protein
MTEENSVYKVGTEVEHKFEESTEWHRGKITKINNKTCTVLYESYNDTKKGKHAHEEEVGISFDKNLRLALTESDIHDIDDEYGVKVHIIEKEGDFIDHGGTLYKDDKHEKYSFIETSKGDNNDAVPFHKDVDINQVLRYDIKPKDLNNNSTVRILEGKQRGKKGAALDVDIENQTCKVKVEKTDETVEDINISSLLLFTKVPEHAENTDELLLAIQEILKSTQDESIKNLIEEECKNILGKKKGKDATIHQAINNALMKLYKSETYVLHDLLDNFFKNDSNKEMYKKNIDYLLGEPEGKKNKKVNVLAKNAVLKNQHGDTPLLHALKAKDGSQIIDLVEDFTSLLTEESAAEKNKNSEYPLHLVFKHKFKIKQIKQVYCMHEKAKKETDGATNRPIQYLDGQLKGNLLNLNEETKIEDIKIVVSHMKAIGEGLSLDEVKTKEYDDSILHLAVKKSELHVIKYLVENHAELLLAKNNAGNLPLHTVMQFSNPPKEKGETKELEGEGDEGEEDEYEESMSTTVLKKRERKSIFDIVKELLGRDATKRSKNTNIEEQLKTKNSNENLPMHLVLMRCTCPTSSCECSDEKTKLADYILKKYCEISTLKTLLKKGGQSKNKGNLLPIHVAILHQADPIILDQLIDLLDKNSSSNYKFPYSNEYIRKTYKFKKFDYVISNGSRYNSRSSTLFKKDELGYITDGPDEDGDYFVNVLPSNGIYVTVGYFKPTHFRHCK